MMKAHRNKQLKVNFADEDGETSLVTFAKDSSAVNDNNTTNGYIIHNNIIPDELLLRIFYMVDTKSLLKCQLVCRHWRYLVRNRVWFKKAQLTLGQSLPFTDEIPWTAYYFVCDERPLYKNLLKNHSGESAFKHWQVIHGGEGWSTECPPQGVQPLPNDPIFDNKRFCFATSFGHCFMEQTIDLIDEGCNKYLLDRLQPTVKVSEWFCSRPNVPAVYNCTIKLFGEQRSDRVAMETLNYTKIIENAQMNHWFKFSHEFKNYGKGLRKIKFAHSGQDRSHGIGGAFGTKMAGACVTLELSP